MKTILITAFAIILASCGLTTPVPANPITDKQPTEWKISKVEYGQASWYGVKCNGGTRTASGAKLQDHASTAAHKTLPMGTKVRVTNLNSGKSEVVKITDRGPYTKGRIIDVTTGVAKRIGFYKNGVAKVKVEVLK